MCRIFATVCTAGGTLTKWSKLQINNSMERQNNPNNTCSYNCTKIFSNKFVQISQ